MKLRTEANEVVTKSTAAKRDSGIDVRTRDEALTPLLSLDKNSRAATAATTTGSDRTKRQKPLNMDTDALPASSADDSVQSQHDGTERPSITQFFPCRAPVTLGENFLGGILTTNWACLE